MSKHLQANGQIRGVAGPQATKAGWRIPEWCAATGVCRTVTYQEIAADKVKSVKRGSSRIITTSPAEYLASLAEEAAGPVMPQPHPGAPAAGAHKATDGISGGKLPPIARPVSRGRQ
jgi:hypothetical protein